MTDHFAVLSQERRPWLDPELLKQAYRQLARSEHPDQQGAAAREGGAPDTSETFAAVNEAYHVLNTPRLRLQHLLSLQTDPGGEPEGLGVPAELAELFMKVASLVGDVECFLQTQAQATSALGKSLLAAKVEPLRTRVEQSLQQLETLYSDSLNELRDADQRWDDNPKKVAAQLRQLADRFGYLERWTGQLREKQFQLSS